MMRSHLFSSVGKVRALVEPFVRSRSQEGETVAQFVRRRAGEEVLTNLVMPAMGNIWAGDPEQLELESALANLFELEKKHIISKKIYSIKYPRRCKTPYLLGTCCVAIITSLGAYIERKI